ncbi:MAG: hypothetical protein KJ065_13600 [Anaerolineae bacterium]|nr:hypothetical protein [Anaerolineae bacterium]
MRPRPGEAAGKKPVDHAVMLDGALRPEACVACVSREHVEDTLSRGAAVQFPVNDSRIALKGHVTCAR